MLLEEFGPNEALSSLVVQVTLGIPRYSKLVQALLQSIVPVAEKVISSASVLQVGSQARLSPWTRITSKKRRRGGTTAAPMPPWNATASWGCTWLQHASTKQPGQATPA